MPLSSSASSGSVLAPCIFPVWQQTGRGREWSVTRALGLDLEVAGVTSAPFALARIPVATVWPGRLNHILFPWAPEANALSLPQGDCPVPSVLWWVLGSGSELSRKSGKGPPGDSCRGLRARPWLLFPTQPPSADLGAKPGARERSSAEVSVRVLI